MVAISRKLTIEEVDKILYDHNLKRLSEEYKNNTTKILCMDNNGYKVVPTINNLKKNKVPRPFDKYNPYTIDNIKKFLEENSPNIELLSKEYVSSDSKLHCKCKNDNFEWYPTWDNLKQLKGCLKCKNQKMSELFKDSLDNIKLKLNIINNDLKILDDKYFDHNTNLRIVCKKGHIFERNWLQLSRNATCPECNKDKFLGGFNVTLAERNKNKWLTKNAIVYIVKIYNDNEFFYKIGITTRTVEARFKNCIPYKYECINTINTNLYDAIYIEQELHQYHNDNGYKYIPIQYFEGWTECFNNIDEEIIKKY